MAIANTTVLAAKLRRHFSILYLKKLLHFHKKKTKHLIVYKIHNMIIQKLKWIKLNLVLFNLFLKLCKSPRTTL